MGFPKTKLAKDIRQAFANSSYPNGDLIATSSYEEDLEVIGIQKFFINRLWYSISLDEANRRSSDILFFTPKTFRYFLPAFMLHSLDPWGGNITNTVIWALCPRDETIEQLIARAKVFNTGQIRSIQRYLIVKLGSVDISIYPS